MKVLLLDAAFAAVPIHEHLVNLGYEVWTIGNRPNDPLAIAFPDRWIIGDYSDVEMIRSIVVEKGFDALVPGCTDVSMDTYVRVGLCPHYHHTMEADWVLNQKPHFRKLCKQLDLPSPRVFSIEALPNEGRFICKPADSFSGRGVTVFDAASRTAASYAIDTAKQHSRSSRVVCEEFVNGQLYSYSAFLESGQVETAYVVREGSRYEPFAVDTSYVVANYNTAKLRQVRDAVEAIGRHLNLCDGLVHVQFIDDGDRIAILEVTRRCPGDLYSRLIEFSTGFPYAARYASYFVGTKVRSSGLPQTRYILRHTIKQIGQGYFQGFELDLGCVPFLLVPTMRLGERSARGRFGRIGLAFIEKTSLIELEDCYANLLGSQISAPSGT